MKKVQRANDMSCYIYPSPQAAIIPAAVVLLSCNTGPPGTSTSNLAQQDVSLNHNVIETPDSQPCDGELPIDALKQSGLPNFVNKTRDHKNHSGARLKVL